MSIGAGERSAEQLSTQPAPVQRPSTGQSPLQTARRWWRQFTSMRTALLLLVLLALGAIPGTLLPQRANSPSRVAKYFADHPGLAHFFDRLGLFDTFHAPWFAAIYVLLFASLVGCVVPRLKQHAAAMLRRPPTAPARLGRLPQSATWSTDLPVDAVLAASRDALRRRRFRAYTDTDTLSAEKGYLRETGNLVFHFALVMLLIGIGIGSLFGYQGQKLLLQGQTFANAQSSYDAFKPGALINDGNLPNFQLTLDKFVASYQSDGSPKTFDAYVHTTNADGTTTAHDLRVNHPLTFGHAKVYLIGHGYSLHVVVRNAAGTAVSDEVVPCIPQDLTNYLSQCVVKVPDTGAKVAAPYTDPKTGTVYTTNADGTPITKPLQFAFLLNFAPTGAIDPSRGVFSTFPDTRLPRTVIGAYSGDLGLDNGAVQSVFNLNTAKLTPITIPASKAIVTPGDGTAVPLTDGFTLNVEGYSQYATLQVKDDPAKLWTLVAAGLIVVGLIGSLRVRRRRLWLRATPSESGRTLVEVGGLARTDADDFAREFRRLVRRLAQAAPPTDAPEPAPDRPGEQEEPDAR
jgi:cytochrome c biogenesis protein